mgnify:CR=1
MLTVDELPGVMHQAALHYFRDALKPNLDRVLQQLQMLLVLVREHDPEVRKTHTPALLAYIEWK